MKQPKFEKEDKARPLKKGISNYYQLKDLFEVEIINPDLYPTYSKKMISVKIIKGTVTNISFNNYSYGQVGDQIVVFEDAFELIISEEQDYDVF